MTADQFLHDIERLIYKENSKNLNTIMQLDKTAQLSTGIFLKLPIVFDLQQVDGTVVSNVNDMKSLVENNLTAYVKHGTVTEVYFTFFYDSESQLNALYKCIEKQSMFFAFLYLHELFHIVHMHNTTSYNDMMIRIAKNIQDPHLAINIAEDYRNNYLIKELFSLSQVFKAYWTKIVPFMMYSHEYHVEKLSDIDILKKMISGAKEPQSEDVGDGFEKVKLDGSVIIKKKGSALSDKVDTADASDSDNDLKDLSETLQGIIEEGTRGTQAGKLIEDAFGAIKVETGWFKQIKASFKKRVFYMTHDYMSSWTGINNTYRRVFKSPKKQFFDNKIQLILAVDHSGSMCTEDLQKLLYLIQSESKNIFKLTVLIHDTRIVKEFTIEDEYDISKSSEFKAAMSTRYAVGGTSHDAVFQRINEMSKDEQGATIFLCFSDMHSDIEECVGNYPFLKRMAPFWIHTHGHKKMSKNKVPGTFIYMS